MQAHPLFCTSVRPQPSASGAGDYLSTDRGEAACPLSSRTLVLVYSQLASLCVPACYNPRIGEGVTGRWKATTGDILSDIAVGRLRWKETVRRQCL